MRAANSNWSVLWVMAVNCGLVFPILNGLPAFGQTRRESAQEGIATAQDLAIAFENVAETIRPSVVNISSVRKIEPRQQHSRRFQTPGGSQFPGGPEAQSPFDDFFGNDLLERFFGMPGQIPRGFVQRGVGTGVIVSEDGYILTNNHVVSNMDEVTVRTADDRQFRGKVVGTDPKTDLAILKINAGSLVPARLGDSSRLRVGQWVVAAGNPFGLGSTITAGIISATGRANVGISEYEDFIQTDAAINPGNSGGPLVNLRGEVVGINTAILSRTGTYMGIGFAIPINMARDVMDSLIREGRVVRGWLGVYVQPLDEALARSFGYESTEGALIGEVVENGPAARAGLQSGDIVIRYNGQEVADSRHLRSLVADTRPGEEVTLEVFRDGQRRKIAVRIQELETQVAGAQAREPESDMGLGLTLHNITPDLAARLGSDNIRGVLVTEVDPLGRAADAGIRENDVILSIQGEPVSSVTDFREVLAKYKDREGVRMSVMTGNVRRFVWVPLKD